MYYLNADGSVEEVKPATSCNCSMCRKKRKQQKCNKWFTVKNMVLIAVIITGLLFLSSNSCGECFSKLTGGSSSKKNTIPPPPPPLPPGVGVTGGTGVGGVQSCGQIPNDSP